MTTSTMIFGDDGSSSADLAWLWINSHPWPHWRLDVITAVTPEHLQVAAGKATPRVWTPPRPRIAFEETQLDDIVHLTIDADPRLALSGPAALLVVGRRGPGLVKAMHLGSTVEWLMIRPPAPLLIARHGRPTRHALICHDGSVHAQAATEAFSRLPWASNVQATVLSIDDGRTDVERALATATQTLQAAGVTVEQQTIRDGEPTLDVLRYLEQHDTDLVVLGTQGLTGVRRLRVGSTAGVLAHATPHSVLLVCASEAQSEHEGH